ncbi:MAG: hypothetical protein KJ072_17640 [Verrucomicrobia bacterium]|nr:hypothetical protein [Verrucomicrobiota bacterium]
MRRNLTPLAPAITLGLTLALFAIAQPAPVTVQPWKEIVLDPDYAGAWVVAGDLTGDGAVEIVTARNVDRNDVHYTSAVAAQRLDSTLLWRWGDPTVGRRELHHDVPCQIHDWDGDGRNEVVLCTDGYLVELDGATGSERRRFPLPKDATDCLVFANLSGGPFPAEVLVKTRYTQIWAFDRDGRSLWSRENPGGYRTAHQPVPVDLDGDGRDEIMAGYVMLNHDGSTRWVYASDRIDLAKGHGDCFRVVRPSRNPDEFRGVLTFCGANAIAMVNGHGQPVWEVVGHHFESVDVGPVIPGASGIQLAVDIDHRPWGQGPVWVLDEQGEIRTRIMTDYARHHALLDWTGDGVNEIVVAQPRTLYDGHGRPLAVLGMDPADDPAGEERLVLTGDFCGDGVPDILLTTRAITRVFIYRNPQGRRPQPPAPLGTGLNVTLY